MEPVKQEPPKFDLDDEDGDDDLDDLLDDLELNPVLFKKPEEPKIQEITEESKEENKEDSNYDGLMWSCADCKMNLPGNKVSELLEKTSASMPGVSCNDIAKHEAFLAATASMLHPNNFQVIITKRILSQMYGRGKGGCESLTDAELHRKMSLCRDLLQYISLVDGGYSQFRLVSLEKISIAKLNLQSQMFVHLSVIQQTPLHPSFATFKIFSLFYGN